MQKYIFFYHLDLKKEIAPMCGSDSIFHVDGRWSLSTIKQKAIERAKYLCRFNREVVAYSVGYLTTHDPENKKAQTICKITKI